MKSAAIVAVLVFVGAGVPGDAQQEVPFAGERIVRVMSRNVSHGVIRQILDVPTARSAPELLEKVAEVYRGYGESNFPERAEALAAEIDAVRPDLVGLQEAILVRTQFPADGGATPAVTVAFDYVELLLDALAARGLRYEVAVRQDGFDFELPSALGFDVRHTDREVILRRSDLSTADLKVWNAQGGNFLANCAMGSPLVGTVTIRRSWVSAEVRIRGASFRLVSTHLDGDCLPFTDAYQRAQGLELLSGPARTSMPVLLIGDLNSRVDGSGMTYENFLRAGFSDAWTLGGAGDGLTCCQDESLRNVVSLLTDRIDFVLFRGEFSTLAAGLVGTDPADRTPSGLWPSDHAGVWAALRLPK